MGKTRVKVKDVKDLRSIVLSLPLKLEGAYLFGSRARGDHLQESDWDVMLVASDFANMPFPQRGTYVLEHSKLRHVDLFCYTPAEINNRLDEIGIVAEALRGIKML